MSIPKQLTDDKIDEVQNDIQLKDNHQQTHIDAENPLQITDLNDDCLEHICKSLNLLDLLNVADTSKRFFSVVRSIFKGKHAKIPVNIRMSNFIQFEESITNLKFLRIFGDCTAFYRNM